MADDMPYVYQDYPRMLYKGDATQIVANDEAKAAAVADGWSVVPGGDPLEDAPVADDKPKGRKAKA